LLDELRRPAEALGQPTIIAASRFAIQLDGTPCDFEMIARIGSGTAIMSPDAAGLARCRQGRSALEQRISKGLPIYGVTTGVGAMKDVSLSPEDLAWFNQGLVQVHRFGTGQPLPSSVVRNAMAIRIIRLLQAGSAALSLSSMRTCACCQPTSSPLYEAADRSDALISASWDRSGQF
jgi:hypothetical protein